MSYQVVEKYRSSSVDRNKKGTSLESTSNFKSNQEDDSMLHPDYLSNYQKRKLYQKHKSSSLSRTKVDSCCKEEEEKNSSNKEINLEYLINRMNVTVVGRMKDELKSKQRQYLLRQKSMSDFKLTLNASQQTLDETVHNVYSMFQENNKLFYEKNYLKKENDYNNNDYVEMIEGNEQMRKDIAFLQQKTRSMKMNAFCCKKELQEASLNCKVMSQSVSQAIEDKKSLITGLLIVRNRMEKLLQVVNAYKKNERCVADQITLIIENYG